MTIAATASPVKTKCGNCSHPKSFHSPSRAGRCGAYSCDCMRFTALEAPATPPKNLAEYIEREPALLADLKSDMGHRALAEKWPLTTESSIRRWRKANLT